MENRLLFSSASIVKNENTRSGWCCGWCECIMWHCVLSTNDYRSSSPTISFSAIFFPLACIALFSLCYFCIHTSVDMIQLHHTLFAKKKTNHEQYMCIDFEIKNCRFVLLFFFACSLICVRSIPLYIWSIAPTINQTWQCPAMKRREKRSLVILSKCVQI